MPRSLQTAASVSRPRRVHLVPLPTPAAVGVASPAVIPEELKAAGAKVQRGEAVSATVRAVLTWFGEARRSAAAIERIASALTTCELAAHPSIADAWIDETITFGPLNAPAPQPTSSVPLDAAPAVDRPATAVAVAQVQTAEVLAVKPLGDPVNRVGAISAAHRQLVFISPDAPLSDAHSVLRLDGLSCVTVATHQGRKLVGMLTWRSLAKALASTPPTTSVRAFAEPAREYDLEADVFEVARTVRQEGPVLVRHGDGRLFGPITAEDFLEEFGTRLEPFLLIGELESVLRTLVEERLPEAMKLLRDERPSSASGPTLGECQALLQREENHRRAGLDFERVQFNQRLDKVREIRNDLMHFNRGEAVGPGEIATLRNFVRALRESTRGRT